jgi:hypothetical protein
MTRSVLLAFALAVAGSAASFAQSSPTREEQLACRSDAQKLCSAHIGKPQPMNSCLRENKARLSEGCRKVVEARGG